MAGTDPSNPIGESTSDKAARAAAAIADPSVPGGSATDPSNPLKTKEPDVPGWVTKETRERKPRWDNVPEFSKLPEGMLDTESFWSNDPSQMQMQLYFSRNPGTFVPGSDTRRRGVRLMDI
jgi:hypothetical protein